MSNSEKLSFLLGKHRDCCMLAAQYVSACHNIRDNEWSALTWCFPNCITYITSLFCYSVNILHNISFIFLSFISFYLILHHFFFVNIPVLALSLYFILRTFCTVRSLVAIALATWQLIWRISCVWPKCSSEDEDHGHVQGLWLEGIQLRPEINNEINFLLIRLCFINVYTYPNPKPTP